MRPIGLFYTLFAISIILVSIKAAGNPLLAQNRVSSQELSISEMQRDIYNVWNLWFESRKKHIRRVLTKRIHTWPTLSRIVAESIKNIQHNPVKIRPKGRGYARLPIGKDTHLIVSIMAIYESKVDIEAEGKAGEVGILQCHPNWCLTRDPELKKLPWSKRKALGKEDIQRNIRLAIETLAVSYRICNHKIEKLKDWIYPVSYYRAGSEARPNGYCIKTSAGKRKIRSLRRYKRKLKVLYKDI